MNTRELLSLAPLHRGAFDGIGDRNERDISFEFDAWATDANILALINAHAEMRAALKKITDAVGQPGLDGVFLAIGEARELLNG